MKSDTNLAPALSASPLPPAELTVALESAPWRRNAKDVALPAQTGPPYSSCESCVKPDPSEWTAPRPGSMVTSSRSWADQATSAPSRTGLATCVADEPSGVVTWRPPPATYATWFESGAQVIVPEVLWFQAVTWGELRFRRTVRPAAFRQIRWLPSGAGKAALKGSVMVATGACPPAW